MNRCLPVRYARRQHLFILEIMGALQSITTSGTLLSFSLQCLINFAEHLSRSSAYSPFRFAKLRSPKVV